MKLHELVTQLRSTFRDGDSHAPVVAITPDGTTFSVREVAPERHEDDGSVTVWLKIEEN